MALSFDLLELSGTDPEDGRDDVIVGDAGGQEFIFIGRGAFTGTSTDPLRGQRRQGHGSGRPDDLSRRRDHSDRRGPDVVAGRGTGGGARGLARFGAAAGETIACRGPERSRQAD